MAYVLILGAKSDIARALARQYAAQGYDLYLAARRHEELARDADDLGIRYGVEVRIREFDVLDTATHRDFFARLDPVPQGTICLIGYLGDQSGAEREFQEAGRIIDTNYRCCVSILNIIAEAHEGRGEGFIVGVGSVAGDRGRKSNYIYGSAKAAFAVYLSGLRSRLKASGVDVLTVKPGFVNTRMTEGMNLPARLTAEPDEAARDIFRAQQRGRAVVYTRWYWRYIMCIIVHTPEKIFQRLPL